VQETLYFLNSKYAEYSGNVKKAFATGEAFYEFTILLRRIPLILTEYSRVYYNKGTIVNKENTLVSKGNIL
jgi:hypothetical protein